MTDEVALNVAARLRRAALAAPDKIALRYPVEGGTFEALTYRDFDARSDAFARGLVSVGIVRGTKTIVMVPPGPDLFAVAFALFKIGAVPVIVDPGMGVDRMLHCYRAAGATAFVGISIAHAVRRLSFRTFRGIETAVLVGEGLAFGAHRLADIAVPSEEPMPLAETRASDRLVINFTTGSTGPAKGVEYTHGMADAMVQQIETLFGESPESVSLATLPLFALFDLLVGATSVLPRMDPRKPAHVDPREILGAIDRFGVTHMFASPALLHRVGSYAAEHGLTAPTMRVVVSGGAPVALRIVDTFRKALAPEARLFCTYGATESLPIAAIESAELTREVREDAARGRGTCVGRPPPEVEVRIVRIDDEPMPTWSDALEVPRGEVGEIAISGPTVSPAYHESPEYDAKAKIRDGARLWHRTGDLGALDDEGRIWFAGRKSQRVRTAGGELYTVKWEGVFDAHPAVQRSALVGVGERGDEEPVVCIELTREVDAATKTKILNELASLKAALPGGAAIRTFLVHPGFPVDIRHNAKIGRETLARWAARKLGRDRLSLGALALRVIPIAGWLFILVGVVHPFEHPLLRAAFWIDVLLSVGAHGAQLVRSIPVGDRAGYSRRESVLYTFLFGATWWKALDRRDRDVAGVAR